MSAIGIFNGNSRIQDYLKSCKQIPQTKPSTFSITAFAERAATRLECAMLMIHGGLVVKGSMLAAEYTRQLELLTDFVQEENEVM